MIAIPNLSMSYFHNKRLEAYDAVLSFQEFLLTHLFADTEQTAEIANPAFQTKVTQQIHFLKAKINWLGPQLKEAINEIHTRIHEATQNNQWEHMGPFLGQSMTRISHYYFQDIMSWTTNDDWIKRMAEEAKERFEGLG